MHTTVQFFCVLVLYCSCIYLMIKSKKSGDTEKYYANETQSIVLFMGAWIVWTIINK